MDEERKRELKDMIAGVVKDQMESSIERQANARPDWASLLNGDHSRESDEVPAEKGLAVARIVRAWTASNGDIDRAKRFADRAWKDALGKNIVGFFEKAVSAGDFTGGGFIIPPDIATDIIDLLTPRTIMRAAGTPVVPMPRGTLTMPKQTGDVSANYIGENEDITKSEPTGGQIVLSAKKLSALVPVSNDLLLYNAGNQADTYIRNTMVRRIAIREDKAFLRDDGTQHTPKGLRHWAASGNVYAANTTVNPANIEDDLVKAIDKLEGADVDMSRPVWLMAPRTKNYLAKLREAAGGNLLYPEMRNSTPTLLTYPVFVSNNIPTNLGSGTDESEVYLVNVPDTLIGEAGGLEIAADSSASYIEGGSLVSAFSRDQTVIRAIVRHDFGCLYEESVAIITGVKWFA